MIDGLELKKQLTIPYCTMSLYRTIVKRRSLAEEEDDDPWMTKAAATVGAPAPLSTSSNDDERPSPKMARTSSSDDDRSKAKTLDSLNLRIKELEDKIKALITKHGVHTFKDCLHDFKP